MPEIIKAVAIALICAVSIVIVKQYRPEYAFIAQCAGIVAVFVLCTETIKTILEYTQSLLPEGVIEGGYISIIIKALAVAIISNLAAELCRDSGNSALAFTVETAAEAAIILLCLPMLKNLSELAFGLLKG